MQNIQTTSDPKVNLFGALSCIGMALCYITLFIIYGAVLNIPHGAELGKKLDYITANSELIRLSYIIGYMLFSLFLCVAVQAIHLLHGKSSRLIMGVSTSFGLFWVGILIAAGMIAISALNMTSNANNSNGYPIELIYWVSALMERSLGGGIEVIGGIWILLLGIASLRHHFFSKLFAIFSMVKGIIGIITLISEMSILRDLFGLTGIVWFIWIAIELYKQAD